MVSKSYLRTFCYPLIIIHSHVVAEFLVQRVSGHSLLRLDDSTLRDTMYVKDVLVRRQFLRCLESLKKAYMNHLQVCTQ